jgi:hypothetical protein
LHTKNDIKKKRTLKKKLAKHLPPHNEVNFIVQTSAMNILQTNYQLVHVSVTESSCTSFYAASLSYSNLFLNIKSLLEIANNMQQNHAR